MKIANPIYDTVFKYLLTNNKKVAMLVISTLIGKKVIGLTINPTEILAKKDKRKPLVGRRESYTVLRLDFAAKIKNDDGSEELILIEMQKAKLITDIMRFRKYLGSQYMNESHRYKVAGKEVALPIFPIYFLGDKLDDFKEEVISIKRSLYNGITNEKIAGQSEFINGLTHDAMIIQIPCVTEKMATRKKRINQHLKELLKLFDQNKHDEHNKNFLYIDKGDLPEWAIPILRELEKAAQDPEVKNQMQLEDDWIADIEDLERQIEDKDKALEENAKVLEENAKVLEEKAKALESKDKALADSQIQIAKLKAQLEKQN